MSSITSHATRDDAFALVTQAKIGCLEGATDEFILELQGHLLRWVGDLANEMQNRIAAADRAAANLAEKGAEEAPPSAPDPVASKLDFETALARFLHLTQQHLNEYYAREFPRNTVPQLDVSAGGVKYVRVFKQSGSGSRDAFCFVEVATGDVLYPDGWKRPAKGARGSIYSPTFEGFGVSQYGANRAR